MNAICSRFDAKFEGISAKYDNTESTSAFAAAFTESRPVVEDALKQLNTLRPNASDSAPFDAFVAALRRQRGYERRGVPKAKANEAPAVKALLALMEKASKARVEAAAELGAERCSKP